jgi:predicted kinase
MSDRPKLILVPGPSGIGKTFIGKALSGRMHIPYLDLDTVCEGFLAVISGLEGGERPYDLYAQAYRDVCYKTILGLAAENLALRVSIVVTAPFFREMGDPDFFPRLKRENGVDFVSYDVRILISERRLRENLVKRGSYRDAAKLQDWESFLSKPFRRAEMECRFDIPIDKGEGDIGADQLDFLVSSIQGTKQLRFQNRSYCSGVFSGMYFGMTSAIPRVRQAS